MYQGAGPNVHTAHIKSTIWTIPSLLKKNLVFLVFKRAIVTSG